MIQADDPDVPERDPNDPPVVCPHCGRPLRRVIVRTDGVYEYDMVEGYQGAFDIKWVASCEACGRELSGEEADFVARNSE